MQVAAVISQVVQRKLRRPSNLIFTAYIPVLHHAHGKRIGPDVGYTAAEIGLAGNASRIESLSRIRAGCGVPVERSCDREIIDHRVGSREPEGARGEPRRIEGRNAVPLVHRQWRVSDSVVAAQHQLVQRAVGYADLRSELMEVLVALK